MADAAAKEKVKNFFKKMKKLTHSPNPVKTPSPSKGKRPPLNGRNSRSGSRSARSGSGFRSSKGGSDTKSLHRRIGSSKSSFYSRVSHRGEKGSSSSFIGRKGRLLSLIDPSSFDKSNPPALVIDNGSGIMKAGFGTANDEMTRPQLLLNSYVGRPKYERSMITAPRSKVLVGRDCQRLLGVCKLSHPMEGTSVSNWTDIENLWTNVYDTLGAKPAVHPVLLTEPPLTPMKTRLLKAEIFFESFGSPALCMQLPQVLCLYARGQTTGLVVDSGDSLTTAVPIYEGNYDPATVCQIKVGGRHVTRYLAKLLRDEGHNFSTTAEMQVVRKIKDRACQTAFNLAKAKQDYSLNDDAMPGYLLPDGRIIKIGHFKFQAPELLFDPSLMGLPYSGVHETVVDAIAKCPVEQRRQVFSQILLAGGSTMSRGFGLRLLSELRRIGQFTKFSISRPENRQELAWLGGSLLSTLGVFKDMCISRQDFHEMGAQAFYKRKNKAPGYYHSSTF
eukprot:CAMPEP_0114497148 /NCGR_PEP_ID=MMETSP0109-20121206/6158_1 /TAXON_ID=29199 /ORGANISM="Chlorarachnion reptans, Strain CCCM449" /LENGTH=501 /DNA_ID=CAMNT_0001674487 /DNA_START=103 /DNA_END=1608 /DNA_ORIENTATION=-